MSRAIAARSRGSPSNSATISSIARATSARRRRLGRAGQRALDAPAGRAVVGAGQLDGGDPARAPRDRAATERGVEEGVIRACPSNVPAAPGREPGQTFSTENVSQSVGSPAPAAALAPRAALGGRAVRERVRVDLAAGLLLEPVVGDGSPRGHACLVGRDRLGGLRPAAPRGLGRLGRVRPRAQRPPPRRASHPPAPSGLDRLRRRVLGSRVGGPTSDCLRAGFAASTESTAARSAPPPR